MENKSDEQIGCTPYCNIQHKKILGKFNVLRCEDCLQIFKRYIKKEQLSVFNKPTKNNNNEREDG